MPFAPVSPLDLSVGQPMPWALYDKNEKLLLAQGALIDSDEQIEAMMANGLFREVDAPPEATATAAARPASPPQGESQQEEKLLEETKLAIGDPMQLQAQYDGAQARFTVKLIGYLKGKSLIVTSPTRDGSTLLMREGQSFIVRMFSGKSAYAFATSIFKVANVPYPHLHLTYPRSVKGVVVRRGGARAKVRLIAAVRNSAGTSQAGILSDLSTGGGSLLCDAPLGAKDARIIVKFKVTVAGSEQLLQIPGIVRNIQPDHSSDKGPPKVMHGVQFVDVPPEDNVVLTAFVYQKLLEDSADA